MNSTMRHAMLVDFLKHVDAVRCRIGVNNVAYWLEGVCCPAHGLPHLTVRLFNRQISVRGLCCERWIRQVKLRSDLLPFHEMDA